MQINHDRKVLFCRIRTIDIYIQTIFRSLIICAIAITCRSRFRNTCIPCSAPGADRLRSFPSIGSACRSPIRDSIPDQRSCITALCALYLSFRRSTDRSLCHFNTNGFFAVSILRIYRNTGTPGCQRRNLSLRRYRYDLRIFHFIM